MNKEKNFEVMRSFGELQSFVAQTEKLFDEGHNYDSQELYQSALDLFDQARIFTEKLEDLDDNLDLEATNLPALDQYFEGNPVTAYVDARIDFVMGDQSEEAVKRVVEAAKAINDMIEDEEDLIEDCDNDMEELIAYVKTFDRDTAEEVNGLLDVIDEVLAEQDTYSSEEIELIRFYLSHLPMNAKLEIDLLSDRAIELAYKTRRNVQSKL